VYGCDIKMDLENASMPDSEWIHLAQNIFCLMNNLKSVNLWMYSFRNFQCNKLTNKTTKQPLFQTAINAHPPTYYMKSTVVL